MTHHIVATLKDLTQNDESEEFLAYCLDRCGDDGLPVYERINLFDLPRLLPRLFVIDLRNGYKQGLPIKYSGTLIDEHFGKNVQGCCIEDIYRGDTTPDAIQAMYRRCADKREVYFRQRESEYDIWARGLERGAQDLVIVPTTSINEPERGVGSSPKVGYLCGLASFQITKGVTQRVEQYFPLMENQVGAPNERNEQ